MSDVAKHSQDCYMIRSPSCETRMYICLCNGLTDRDVRTQCGGGGCSVSMIYRGLGCEPQCGKCVPMVRQMLREAAPGTQMDAGGGDD